MTDWPRAAAEAEGEITMPGAVSGVALRSGSRPWQATLVRRWAAALTILTALLFTVPTALTLALWATDPNYVHTNPVVDLAFFALGGILVTAGLASQIRGGGVAGVQGTVLALLALSLAGWSGGRIEPLVGGLVLLAVTAPLVALHPERSTWLRPDGPISRPLLVLAALAVVPAIVYASGMLALARSAGPSCFLGRCAQGDRFAEAAALALAVVLSTFLAARRPSGWWVPARSAATGAIVLGVASVAFPGEGGALPWAWGVAAVSWGTAVVVVTQAAPRRRLGSRPRSDVEGSASP